MAEEISLKCSVSGVLLLLCMWFVIPTNQLPRLFSPIFYFSSLTILKKIGLSTFWLGHRASPRLISDPGYGPGTISILALVDNSTKISGNNRPNKSSMRHVNHRERYLKNGLSNYEKITLNLQIN